MLPVLLPVSLFLAAVVMGLALAHALEMPGKMRLNRDQYYVTQTIYYPGFTWGGLAEPIAILVTAMTLAVTPANTRSFWLIVVALSGLVSTQLVFWLRVQPVNRQWLGSTSLSEAAERFFRTGETATPSPNWTRLRDRWENGHLTRALASTAAFVALLIAMSQRL